MGGNAGAPEQEECRPEGPGGMCTPGLRREEIHLDAGYLGGELAKLLESDSE